MSRAHDSHWTVIISAIIGTAAAAVTIIAHLPKYTYAVKWINNNGSPSEMVFEDEDKATAFANQLNSNNLSRDYIIVSSLKNSVVVSTKIIRGSEIVT